MIRIFLVDDHPVVREGIAAILSSEADFRVVGEAGTVDEAFKAIEDTQTDIMVLDLRLPGRTGIDACTELRERHPRVRVVILTSFPNEGAILESLTAGAKAFVVKESDPSILRQAIRVVATGGSFVDPKVSGKLIALATKGRRTKGPFGLTLMEMRVVELLPRGLTNKAIGRELGVSEQTIKTHLYHAMRKMQVKDRAAATAFALREGLA
jgi:DNA-binding NarL/FixJ family response regulator